MKTSTLAFSAATFLVIACVPVRAQQTTGTPGSPDATTTIDGNYLPPPPPKFGGQIGLDAAQSKPSTLSGNGQPGDKYGCSEDFRSN